MKTWLLIAAVNGFLAVAAGAFAAHGLARRVNADALQWFETGARYHAYHSLALLAVAWLASMPALRSSALVDWSGASFLVGIVLFCGSLYVMALTGLRVLGVITPIGGLGFLIGWALLAALAIAQR